MKREKVVVAMSGGVDSSASVKLMLNEGYDCVGMTMRLWKGKEVEETSCSTKSCCGAESVDDARLVAEKFNIPYYAINFKEEFWENVVKVFATEYFSGRTPSPCILCNEKMKFDTLYKKAMEIGAKKICTGHYARILYDEDTKRWNLLKGIDPRKDQTYFLFSMTQEQLSKTLFPCGDYTKEEIRKIAEKEELVTAKKPESMDICFIPDGDYAGFLERHFPEMAKDKKGNIQLEDGTILKEHQGIHSYTIGQRKLGVAFGHPLYVTKIDPETQTVFVGDKEQTQRKDFFVSKVNWISQDAKPGDTFSSLTVRIRSRGPEAIATVTCLEESRAKVVFDTPQHAITPGQAAVFYRGDKVIGGGWIEN